MDSDIIFIIENNEKISHTDLNIIDCNVLKISKEIDRMLNKGNEITLEYVSRIKLDTLIRFCEHYSNEPYSKIESPLKYDNLCDVVGEWYTQFIDIDVKDVFDLLQMSNIIDCKPLLDLCCVKIAMLMKNKEPKEIQDIFAIKESEVIRKVI